LEGVLTVLLAATEQASPPTPCTRSDAVLEMLAAGRAK
jgi:hypothetical protein